jgi:dipeptidyl aminopeptidase/acylaminoacyl peptidase
MGEVYEAQDQVLLTHVALKTILPQFAADPRAQTSSASSTSRPSSSSPSRGWARSRRSSTATPTRRPNSCAAWSPINKADRIIAPPLVLHGANDTNVPVVEAEQVVARLKKRNVPVELVLFSDEGHGFRKIGNRIKANVEVVRWFVKYLR